MTRSLCRFADRIQQWIRTGSTESGFESLALELFQLQVRSNTAYRRYVEVLGLDPARIASVHEIPAVPTQAFKELELTSLPPGERTRVFHSSGTTSQKPSRHFHGEDSLALYEASAVAGFRRGFWGQSAVLESPIGTLNRAMEGAAASALEREARRSVPLDFGWRSVSLTPPPREAPHSSLVHMIDSVGRDAIGGQTTYMGRVDTTGVWDVDFDATSRLLDQVSADGRPVALYGTAFHFVHLIEGWDRMGRSVVLPPGSRVMETGGYKGRCREWSKVELRTGMSRVLGVGRGQVIGEYGMSELSSQGYEVRNGSEPEGMGLVFPPWAMVLVMDPETGRRAGEGQPGLVRVLDLANVWSVMAVQTEDRGVSRGGVLEILGRAPAAEPRGCSLMAA